MNNLKFFFVNKIYLSVRTYVKAYELLLIFSTSFLVADLLEFKCPYEVPTLEPVDQTKSHQEQINEINEQIKELEDLREKYLAKAAIFQDLGDRLQFFENYQSEARKYWDLADCALEVINEIEKKIAQLKDQVKLLAT